MKFAPLCAAVTAHLFLATAAFAAPAAILTRVSGTVVVQRGVQKLPGKSGLALQKGDNVVVQKGSATIFSLGAPPRTLNHGALVVGIAAPAKAESASLWKSVYLGLERGLGNSGRVVAATMRRKPVVTLVSPVKTAVDTAKPRFIWDPLKSVARYEIVIMRGEVEVFRAQTEGNLFELPATAPVLEGKLFWKAIPLERVDGGWLPRNDVNASRSTPFEIASPVQIASQRSDLSALDKALKLTAPAERFLARAALPTSSLKSA